MRKSIMNNQGITLLELLLALAVSTIVIGVVTSVLITSIKNYQVVQNHSIITQEANIVIKALTETHKKSQQNYTITLNNQDELLIGSYLYENDSYEIHLSIRQYSINPSYVQLINSSFSVNKNESLDIKLTLVEKASPSNRYEITTVINKL